MSDAIGGRLRHRITLQEPVLTPDTAGGYTKTWSDVATLWAEIEPVRSRDPQERLNAQQLESRIQHRITIRYRDDVTPAMRIAFGDRIFNIRSVINPAEGNALLEILAEEGVGS